MVLESVAAYARRVTEERVDLHRGHCGTELFLARVYVPGRPTVF